MGWAECAAAHLWIRASTHYALCHSRCCAMIFVDVISAFVEVFRNLASHDSALDTAMADILSENGVAHEDIHLILDPALRKAEWGTTPEHVQWIIQRLISSQWTAFDMVPGVFLPRRSIQAGVPLSDLMYIIVASRISKMARQKLLELNLLEQLDVSQDLADLGISHLFDSSQPLTIGEASIMDDVA